MSEVKSIQPIEITALGGSETFAVARHYDLYVLYTTSAVTLTGDFTISPTGTPSDATVFTFNFIGSLTLSHHTLDIFGRSITQKELDNKCMIICYYDIDTTTWTVSVITPNNASYFGKVYADSTDTVVDYLDGKVSMSIVESAVTHKIKLDGDVLSPGANKIYSTDSTGKKGWNDGTADILFTEITLYDTDILTLNSVPVSIIPAPGVGFMIDPIGFTYETINWAAPYATNINLYIYTNTTTPPNECVTTSGWVLRSTISRKIKTTINQLAGAAVNQLLENRALMVMVLTGDPTGGDPYNELKITVAYRIKAV